MEAQVIGTFMSLALGGMAWTFTTEYRELVEDAFGAAQDIGLKQEAAASLLGITASQLSAQKMGRERPNIGGYLACWGKAFRAAFSKRQLKRQDIEVPEESVRDLVTEIRALLDRDKEQKREQAA